MMSLKRSILRAQYDDGLLELGVGIGLLYAAGYLDAGRGVRATAAWMPTLLPLMLALAIRGVRRRYVYPRVGFARPRQDRWWLAVPATVLIAGLVGVGLFVTGRGAAGWRPGSAALGWLVCVPALAGAGLAASVAVRAGLRRYWLHAAALAGGAGVPALLGLPGRDRLIVNALAAAATMLPAGVVAFIRFVRTNPVKETSDDA